MKAGILGGTLDPIHNGHIEIALKAMEVLGLDAVALMPSGDPPHKPRVTDKRDRLAMVRLAAETHPGLYASDVEINREGRTYTVDTLSALSVEQPDVKWTYIIGADTLNTLDSWREFPRVARLCDFAVINRPGCDVELAKLRAQSITACFGTKVTMLPLSGPALSSTRLRGQVAAGEDIGAYVPAAVAEYIREREERKAKRRAKAKKDLDDHLAHIRMEMALSENYALELDEFEFLVYLMDEAVRVA